MRLIDADALLKASRIGKVLYFDDTETEGYTDVLLAVDVERAPTIEAEPVKHGKWIMNSDRPDTIICSKCNVGFDVWKHEQKYSNFCPNCGAKMDGKDDEQK